MTSTRKPHILDRPGTPQPFDPAPYEDPALDAKINARSSPQLDPRIISTGFFLSTIQLNRAHCLASLPPYAHPWTLAYRSGRFRHVLASRGLVAPAFVIGTSRRFLDVPNERKGEWNPDAPPFLDTYYEEGGKVVIRYEPGLHPSAFIRTGAGDLSWEVHEDGRAMLFVHYPMQIARKRPLDLLVSFEVPANGVPVPFVRAPYYAGQIRNLASALRVLAPGCDLLELYAGAIDARGWALNHRRLSDGWSHEECDLANRILRRLEGALVRSSTA